MRLRLLQAVLVTAALVTAVCGSGSQPASNTRSFTLGGQAMVDCILTGGADAKCGVLKVAENPADDSGRKIDIRVEVIPAQSQAGVGAPVFFISGGPGGAATADWAAAPTIFPKLNRLHDIVLVDQRGTGSSHRLVVPEMLPGESLTEYARRALAGIDGDPRFYTTAVAMDDIDAVRQALGYKTIDLYGGSYGATAVQYYMRQHGDHVTAAVLDGGTLLDVPVMELIAANSQLALDDLFARCLADVGCSTAYPNVRNEFATVLARLDTAQVPTTVVDAETGEPIVVTHDYFAGVVHNLLLTATAAASIPWVVHRAWSGHFEDVAQGNSGGSLPTLVMSIEIRCSEAWARFEPQEVSRTGAGSYYLSAQLNASHMQTQVCPLLPRGYVTPEDAMPVQTKAAVLLLNGGADPQDPPSNVAAAKKQMPNSFSLVVPGQGHTVGHINCLPLVVVDFFDAGKADVASAEACAAQVLTPPFRLS